MSAEFIDPPNPFQGIPNELVEEMRKVEANVLNEKWDLGIEAGLCATGFIMFGLGGVAFEFAPAHR